MRVPGLLILLLPAWGFAQAPRDLEAGGCAVRHTRIPKPCASWDRDAGFIGPFHLWQNSMMAYAAADPHWEAKVAFLEC